MILPSDKLSKDASVDYVLQVGKSDLVRDSMPAAIAAEILERAHKLTWCEKPIKRTYDLAVVPDKGRETFFFSSKHFQGLPEKPKAKASKRHE